MTPVDMSVLHNPKAGLYGDCQRACIASILHKTISSIPHFYEHGNVDIFYRLVNSYLSTQGLFHLETTEFDFGADHFCGIPNFYHMIYGPTSRDTQHAVVGMNGSIIHDPHPSRDGLLVGPEDWTYGFLIQTFSNQERRSER